MKRIALSVGIAILPLLAAAQDTVDLSSYPYSPRIDMLTYLRSDNDRVHFDCNQYAGINGIRHYTSSQTAVYGVAMPLILDPDREYSVDIAPAIVSKEPDGRLRATVGTMFPTDNIANRSYDFFLKVPYFPSCDSNDTAWGVLGMHSFYFDSPVTVRDTFYYGQSTRYNNGFVGSGGGFALLDFYCSSTNSNGSIHADSASHPIFHFVVTDSVHNYVRHPYYYTDYRDFTIPFILLTTPPPGNDTFSCPDIYDFSFLGLQAGAPAFAWSVADEHRRYEICYGPYDADPETLPKVSTSAGFLELSGIPLDPDTYYQARCRAMCRHACRVHDTTLWTPWSEPQFFFVGEHMPDTAHADTATTGIYQTPARTHFSVSPNPARDEVSVTIDDNYQDAIITFRDSEGRELIRQHATQRRTSVCTKHLPKGIFLVTVTTKNNSASQKIILK